MPLYGATIRCMAHPLPRDLKQRAEDKCKKEYPYLTLQDPGTVLKVDGKVLVFVLDQKKRGLWLEV